MSSSLGLSCGASLIVTEPFLGMRRHTLALASASARRRSLKRYSLPRRKGRPRGVTSEYVALPTRCIGVENVTPSHQAALPHRKRLSFCARHSSLRNHCYENPVRQRQSVLAYQSAPIFPPLMARVAETALVIPSLQTPKGGFLLRQPVAAAPSSIFLGT
jgi:hypothetical protein